MNLNERGEGIFEFFLNFLDCPRKVLLTTTTSNLAQEKSLEKCQSNLEK